jgi:hypothetical protein
MTIEFRCSQCNQLLRVPEDAAGKNARCPKCQALMIVPGTNGGSAAEGTQPAFPDAVVVAPPAAGQEAYPFGSASTGPAASPKPPPFQGDAPKPAAAAADQQVNPYAPSLPAHGYVMSPRYFGPRPGLPWETKGQSFATWWETTKLCMLQPSYAFSVMHETGGLGQPMMFAAVGLAIGTFGQMLWYIPIIGTFTLFGAGRQAEPGELAFMIGLQVVWQVFNSVMAVVMGATIGLIIGAAIIHVCLMIVGGAKKPFETTLRVLGYAQGATAWLNIIPGGFLVAAGWVLVAEIIGLAKAHEIEMGKSALAVFLPIIVCGGCMIGIIGAAVAVLVVNSQ